MYYSGYIVTRVLQRGGDLGCGRRGGRRAAVSRQQLAKVLCGAWETGYYDFFKMHRLSSYIHRLTDEYIQCHHVSPAMYVHHLWDVKYRRTIFHVQVGPCGSHKNYVGTRCAELVCFATSAICGSRSVFCCIPGVESRRIIIYAWVAPMRIPQNTHRDTSCRTYVFAFSGVCGSRSSF
jgi:hypothetical protein